MGAKVTAAVAKSIESGTIKPVGRKPAAPPAAPPDMLPMAAVAMCVIPLLLFLFCRGPRKPKKLPPVEGVEEFSTPKAKIKFVFQI